MLSIDSCMIGNGEIRNTSGNLQIKNTNIQGLKISSTSGSTVFTGVLTGKTDIKSTSGSITLDIAAKKQDYDINVKAQGGKYISTVKSKSNAIAAKTEKTNCV